MKRTFFLFITLFISLIANAQTGIRYTSTHLYLRYGPGKNYAAISIVPKGTMVTIDEDCNCKWVPVEYNGYVGYISTQYLTKEKVESNKETFPSSVKHYINSRGERVQSPTRYDAPPAGATALCRDGTYSFSKSRRGTCSHHGGVAKWLK